MVRSLPLVLTVITKLLLQGDRNGNQALGFTSYSPVKGLAISCHSEDLGSRSASKRHKKNCQSLHPSNSVILLKGTVETGKKD